MPQRTLNHGCAPTCTGQVLEPGSFTRDVQIRGQFLIDMEFLSRYTLGQFTCVYMRDPGYLDQLAGLFPWLQFQVYGCEQECEYNPEQPGLSSPVTGVTKDNITRWYQGFTRVQAAAYGARPPSQSLVLVCHGLESTYQLLLHVQSRAQASLLDIVEPPDDYADGELLLPMYANAGCFMLFLVATMRSVGRPYNGEILREELGFVQGVLRATDVFDLECCNLILGSYAQRFSSWLGTSELMAETLGRLALEAACQSLTS